MFQNIITYFLLLSVISMSCNGNSVTPIKYRYFDTVKSEIYLRNKKEIHDSIRHLIYNRADPYYQKENDSMTVIFIDTILYSPEKNKIAFFVITQNSNDKLLGGGDKNKFHYDSHCFIGILNDTLGIKEFVWISAFNISNYNDMNLASTDIRNYYFEDLAKGVNLKGENTFKYNFNDVRFWDGPVWNKYF